MPTLSILMGWRAAAAMKMTQSIPIGVAAQGKDNQLFEVNMQLSTTMLLGVLVLVVV